MRRRVVIAATLLIGVLIGTMLASLAPKLTSRRPVDTEHSELARLDALAAESVARIEKLQSRLDARDARDAIPPTKEMPQPPVQATLAPTANDAERSRRETLSQWQAGLAAHHAQRVDTAFSQPATAALEGTLSEVGKDLGFEVLDTDCRSTSCAAIIEWPNYGYAIDHYRETMTLPRNLNCSTGTVLPEPEDPAAPYAATIVFDNCALSRGPEKGAS